MVGLFRTAASISTFFLRWLFKVVLVLSVGIFITKRLTHDKTPYPVPLSESEEPAYEHNGHDSPIKPVVFRPADLTPGADFFDEETRELKQSLLERLRTARDHFLQQAKRSVHFHSDSFLNKLLSKDAKPIHPQPGAHTREIPEGRVRHKQYGRLLQSGTASFYGKRWNGRKTANGEIYNAEKFTAAHKNLPFNTYVRVVRQDDGRSVVVRINDRGPFIKGRIIDLSTAGARRLGMLDEGITDVRLYEASVADFLKQYKRR